LIIFINSFHP
jgi:RAD54-like protein 2